MSCQLGLEYANCKGKRPYLLQKRSPGYDKSEGGVPLQEIREVWNIFSLPLLPGLLWPGVVVPNYGSVFLKSWEKTACYSYSTGILDAM